MTLPTLETPRPAAASRAPQRIEALDWIKGALILFMVAYHAINYSVYRPLAFQYLAFLPPSFILITGFLVGQVYAKKYDLQSWKPYLRLASRGAKLLFVFLILNVAHCIVLQRSVVEGLWEFGDRSSSIFLSGNGREGIFEVLLPIAYFLLLAPGLLWLRNRFRPAVVLGAFAVAGICVGLEVSGQSSKNLALLSAGFIGVALGLVDLRRIDRLARFWPVTLLLYALYRVCSYRFGENYSLQISGAVLSLLLLYACAAHLDLRSRPGRELTNLGNYSLLGYLAQILLLQLVVRFCGGKPGHWYGVLTIGVLTTVLLLLMVRLVKALRTRSMLVESGYRLVFS